MSLVSLSTDTLQKILGDMGAIRYAKEIGCDAIDFNLCNNDFTNRQSIYFNGEDEISKYYTAIAEYAKSQGIIIHQTQAGAGADRIIGQSFQNSAHIAVVVGFKTVPGNDQTPDGRLQCRIGGKIISTRPMTARFR